MYKPAIIARDLMNELFSFIKPSITTDDINNFCHEYITRHKAVPAALNYKGFPKSICTSVNSIVCHGIPNSYQLKNGDIISVDVAIEFEGYYADNCITIPIGSINPREQKMIEVCHDSMWNTIEIIKSGVSIKKLGAMMENTALKYGFNVIKDFCGHGIGKSLHEEPAIAFYACDEDEYIYLEEGMFITIEPMITMGNHKLVILSDGWSARMRDNKNTAQFEHTIYVGRDGYEVLTYNDYDEKRKKIKSNLN